MQTQQEAMPRGDAPLQGGAQLLRRRLDAALHQGEQLVGIAFAVDEGLQYGAAGNPQRNGRRAIQPALLAARQQRFEPGDQGRRIAGYRDLLEPAFCARCQPHARGGGAEPIR